MVRWYLMLVANWLDLPPTVLHTARPAMLCKRYGTFCERIAKSLQVIKTFLLFAKQCNAGWHSGVNPYFAANWGRVPVRLPPQVATTDLIAGLNRSKNWRLALRAAEKDTSFMNQLQIVMIAALIIAASNGDSCDSVLVA